MAGEAQLLWGLLFSSIKYLLIVFGAILTALPYFLRR